MEALVKTNTEGRNVTTSLIIAEIFGKRHDAVLRDIQNLDCPSDFNLHNFGEISYTDTMNREQRAYELTKDGFSFLVMGYTGAKAAKFKVEFINEFNKREDMLKSDDYILFRAAQIQEKKILALENSLIQKQQVVDHQQKQIETLQPKAELMDKVMDCGEKIDVGQAAKILKLPFGRNTLFAKLREKGIFFQQRNEPKQQYINQGYFEVYESYIQRENHDSFLVVKVLVTQKGLSFLNKAFNGEMSDRLLAKIQ